MNYTQCLIIKQEVRFAIEEAVRQERMYSSIEHLMDADFEVKAPRYSTAWCIPAGQFVGLKAFVSHPKGDFFIVQAEADKPQFSLYVKDLDCFGL